uniref:Calcium-binding tyrosine phosphorylation-regulated protein n=1 Tax=Anas platyrhynchos TaxID=8839 RepID=A0A8B9THR2_ANAPL
MKMTELSVPESLHTLLEGVTAAVIKNKPVDTAEFVALYFQDFIAFHRENLNLNLEEVVKKFHFKYGKMIKGRHQTTETYSISSEPQKKEVSTDTEEDQLLEDIVIECSSKVIQCPSAASSVAENKPSTGPDGASSPEGPELAYVPADPEQLATHILGNTDSAYSVRDVATSVQTLNEDSQASETSFTLVDDDEEDDAAALAAGASVEAVRSQPGVHQADVSANDAEQVSSSLLQEDPFPPPPPPPPSLSSQWQLQVAPPGSAAEAISTAEGWDKPTVDAEVPPFTEQFPEKIIIPFIEQTAYLLKIDVGQVSCAKTLGPPAAAAVCQPEGVESTAHMESAEAELEQISKLTMLPLKTWFWESLASLSFRSAGQMAEFSNAHSGEPLTMSSSTSPGCRCLSAVFQTAPAIPALFSTMLAFTKRRSVCLKRKDLDCDWNSLLLTPALLRFCLCSHGIKGSRTATTIF